ncbi:MAG TPA: DNA gyrase subunit A [Desulfofustis sp.]|nr:DNA gyrase subunit A [Desulfofustis sp.]
MNETTDITTPPDGIAIELELKKSYIGYAMSVIVGRALPDVRDGLKPVHRRVLYTMHELGVQFNRPYVKSARIVGEVLGKYHPHGDSAAYDTLVRLAQNFSMRYPLVDGQGNFGSLDGDAPAAMRYTEARMTRIDREIVADIDKQTVDFTPNYDNSLTEPVIMPSRIPNLLINGSSGIAVGMATNIPPHNLNEIIDGLIRLIDDPNISIHHLNQIITGPDFPTGGIICGRNGIREAYETGRGILLLRAKTHIEKSKDERHEKIVVTEIPYQQNKAVLVERIAQLINDKKITAISEIRDESDRQGLRIVMDLKKDEYADIVINQLYAMTPMQKSFGIILLALVNNKPEILNLKQMLEHFIQHRRVVLYRRTAYELQKAEEKAHLLEGLTIAIDNIDEVVALIRAAQNPVVAKEQLMERFSLSAVQAQSILDLRLQRLTGLERDKIYQEYQDTLAEIARLRELLGSDALIMATIKEEFEHIRETYGDERRTVIVDATDEIRPEDLITPEDVAVMVTHSGYIKRNSVSLYRAQHRGGKGVRGLTHVEDDFVTNLYVASTLDTFLFFTNFGKVFWRKVYQLPMAGRTARGKAIINLLELGEGERVAAILPISSFGEETASQTILTVTKYGKVKKTALREFARPLKKGKRALTINEGDEILSAHLLGGDDTVFLISHHGLSIRFHESDVRTMGRIAAGVRGIKLKDSDYVVAANVLASDSEESILIVTENGYGKRTIATEYRTQFRGGKGIIAIKPSLRNGPVIGAQIVDDLSDVILIADSGQMIRMGVESVRIIGRTTQGVRMINLSESERVVGMAVVDKNEDEPDDEPESE